MSFRFGHLKSLTLTALIAVMGSATAFAGENYTIDTGHSFVNFSVDHLGISKAFGRFNDFKGTIGKDESGNDLQVSVTINAGSIDTNSERRDKHLRNADFFNANQFDTIVFQSKKTTKNGDEYTVEGDLTMLGVTKSVTFTLKKTGEGKDPWGKIRIGLLGSATIKRSDYNMNYGLDTGAIGDEVEITVSIEGVKE